MEPEDQFSNEIRGDIKIEFEEFKRMLYFLRRTPIVQHIMNAYFKNAVKANRQTIDLEMKEIEESQ